MLFLTLYQTAVLNTVSDRWCLNSQVIHVGDTLRWREWQASCGIYAIMVILHCTSCAKSSQAFVQAFVPNILLSCETGMKNLGMRQTGIKNTGTRLQISSWRQAVDENLDPWWATSVLPSGIDTLGTRLQMYSSGEQTIWDRKPGSRWGC